MKRYSQLTYLIWDYYRENLKELEQLRLLEKCHVSRRWGVLRLHCEDRRTAIALTRMGELLAVPVAQLRLARKIKIFLNRETFTVFEVAARSGTAKIRDNKQQLNF